jgi:hypothetical protein
MKKLIYLFILVLNIGYSQDLKKVNGVTDTNVKKVATISDTNVKKVNGVNFSSAAGLLDLYPGAGGAWSVRKLDIDYTGYCMKVERASDNTTQDIGFDVNGDLDVAAIATFCGASDGYVHTWYDQSGNNYHAYAENPDDFLIYTSSAVTLKDGRPSLVKNGSGDLVASVSITNIVGNNAFYGISVYTHADNSGNGSSLIFTEDGEIYLFGIVNFGTIIPLFSLGFITISAGSYSATDGEQLIFEGLKVSASQDDIYIGGTQVDSDNAGSASYSPSAGTKNLYIGGSSFAAPVTGVQEVVLYPSNQNSNRSSIYANVIAYF